MLDELRTQIDAVDKQMLALFEERMHLCQRVGEYKKQHNLPVYNHAREQHILREKVDMLCDKSLEHSTEQFFEKMMELSRNLQTDIIRGKKTGTAAYLGIPGSYSEEAAARYFGEDVRALGADTFRGVFELLEDGRADYAVLPVENTSTGSIHDVLDLLYRYECYIVGEVVLDINQCLLGVTGTALSDIREVYSHSQGHAQCSEFLADYPGWKLTVVDSTATAAQYIAQQGDTAKAAIASRRCAEIYGLEVLRENINFKKANNTRFIVVGKQLETTTVADKVSLMFTLSHASGTLFRALQCFADSGLNLLHIESRPLPDRNFEYMFYVDIEGNLYDVKVRDALERTKKECRYFRILGCY